MLRPPLYSPALGPAAYLPYAAAMLPSHLAYMHERLREDELQRQRLARDEELQREKELREREQRDKDKQREKQAAVAAHHAARMSPHMLPHAMQAPMMLPMMMPSPMLHPASLTRQSPLRQSPAMLSGAASAGFHPVSVENGSVLTLYLPIALQLS